MKDLKRGFTLAEVLITLGVISVVAAMTLPTLIQNYKKTAYVNQLKKSYSLWEQAFQKMMADDGIQKLSDTSVWASKGDTNCTPSAKKYLTNDNCKAFVNSLSKYIKIIGVEQYGQNLERLGKGSMTAYSKYYSLILSDGTMVMLYSGPIYTAEDYDNDCNQIKSLGGSMCSDAGSMIIDINGRKGPNTYGRDVFYFMFSDEGKLYPYGGKDTALLSYMIPLDSNNSYWRNKGSNTSCGNANGTIPPGDIGQGCAARIMENGWKMDY